jgi:hypothetical protein
MMALSFSVPPLPMPDLLAPLLVLLAGLYLVALGAAAWVVPQRAARFLNGFAESPGRHYAELGLRLLVGGAFVLHAPGMRFPAAFTLFGWLLVGTTVALLLVPWTWHRRFARQAVPVAVAHLRLLAAGSLVLGGAVLAALRWGAA